MRIVLRTVATCLLLAVPAACASSPEPSTAELRAAQPVIDNGERSGAAEVLPGAPSDALRAQSAEAHFQDKDDVGTVFLARGTEADAGIAETKAQTANDQAKHDQAMPSVATPREDPERLQQQLAGLPVKQTPRGIVVTFGSVVFKTNSAELLPDAMAGLDRLATYLKETPSSTAQIEGYTDSSSSADYNLGLSQRRADSLCQALVARGVDPSRIDARGYGATAPVAGNDTAQGRQINRRVEVVIAGPGGQAPQASRAPR